MFIGSLVIASAVAGTVIVEIGSVSDTIEVRGTSIADEIETDVAIISDESQSETFVSDGGDEVTILAKNIGHGDIPRTEIDVLVDGSYTNTYEYERVDVDKTDDWGPGGVVELTITPESTVSGDTTVTVIADGNEDTIAFYYDGS